MFLLEQNKTQNTSNNTKRDTLKLKRTDDHQNISKMVSNSCEKIVEEKQVSKQE